jgi:predicted dehydrogenase
MGLRLGLLSTAAINAAILAGARGTERVEVVAVASRDAAQAEAYAREHGLGGAHGGYDALLADSDLDAVYVSLPNGLHHEWTLRALAAGKHVLCEKPYSRDPAEVEEAFDAAERAGLVLSEAFMYRHHPQTRIVRELVAGGRIGRLRSIRAAFTFPLRDDTNIRMLAGLDGGALMDVGCYCVSAARLLAGEPERAQAEAVVSPGGVDVALHGSLRFADDVVAQLECSFLVPRRQQLVAVGEEATLVVGAPFRVDWGGAVELVRDGRREPVDVPEADSYTLELENLADAVEGRAPALLGRDDALGQARTIAALYRAAETGASVALSA